MTMHPIPSEFPFIWKILFRFYQCVLTLHFPNFRSPRMVKQKKTHGANKILTYNFKITVFSSLRKQ
jgi:hypothetical protein